MGTAINEYNEYSCYVTCETGLSRHSDAQLRAKRQSAGLTGAGAQDAL